MWWMKKGACESISMSQGQTDTSQSIIHSMGSLSPFRGLSWQVIMANLAQQGKTKREQSDKWYVHIVAKRDEK